MTAACSRLINPYGELFELVASERDELKLALRKKLIWAYSWAVPSADAIAALVERGPLIELGAGTGYWAWLVAQAGGKIVAFDREPLQPPRWFDVRQGTSDEAARFADHTLFLCWPPLDEALAARALAGFRGQCVAYVGEFRGRTASAEFHDALDAAFTQERAIALPRWPGYHDSLFIYRRRS